MTRLGCNRSPPDARDFQYRVKLKAVLPVALPSYIDYTKKMTSVKDQGDEGACVGFASVAMKEYQEKKEWKYKCHNFSERYVYEKAKAIDGDPQPHEGTTIRAAMDVLHNHGVCNEKCWPYVANVPKKPCSKAESEAKPNRIANYLALEDIHAMKQALVSNGPFVVGIDVYPSFYDEVDGVIPMPYSDEQIEGGHAICIVGYFDVNSMFKFKNSWSNKWGDKGYGYLFYDYMKKYSFDSWLAVDLP